MRQVSSSAQAAPPQRARPPRAREEGRGRARAGGARRARLIEKKREAFLVCTMLPRTVTLYVCPGESVGTRVEQVRIHWPSTRTSQVPHSPLPHLYLMNWPACAATCGREDRGWQRAGEGQA